MDYVVERVPILASLGEVSLRNIVTEHRYPDQYTLLQKPLRPTKSWVFRLPSKGWKTLTFVYDRCCFERLWTVLEDTLTQDVLRYYLAEPRPFGANIDPFHVIG